MIDERIKLFTDYLKFSRLQKGNELKEVFFLQEMEHGRCFGHWAPSLILCHIKQGGLEKLGLEKLIYNRQ